MGKSESLGAWGVGRSWDVADSRFIMAPSGNTIFFHQLEWYMTVSEFKIRAFWLNSFPESSSILKGHNFCPCSIVIQKRKKLNQIVWQWENLHLWHCNYLQASLTYIRFRSFYNVFHVHALAYVDHFVMKKKSLQNMGILSRPCSGLLRQVISLQVPCVSETLCCKHEGPELHFTVLLVLTESKWSRVVTHTSQ